MAFLAPRQRSQVSETAQTGKKNVKCLSYFPINFGSFRVYLKQHLWGNNREFSVEV